MGNPYASHKPYARVPCKTNPAYKGHVLQKTANAAKKALAVRVVSLPLQGKGYHAHTANPAPSFLTYPCACFTAAPSCPLQEDASKTCKGHQIKDFKKEQYVPFGWF